AMSYIFTLPTTGSLSFADNYTSTPGNAHAADIAQTTQLRASLRALLKESRHTDGEKDYMKLVKILEEYLPHLFALDNCVRAGEITCTKEPIFSWRTTLSSHLFSTAPRLALPALPSELTFSLLTYAFALSNLARASVLSLGQYEVERGISDVERRAKDERLGFAVSLFCRASGVFAFVADDVLAEGSLPAWPRGLERPPELSKEVASALSKLNLAAAQSLAIRKLLSKAAFDSTVAPGPPLPKSHPSPSLIAKLHLEAAALSSAALALLRIPGASKARLKSPAASASGGGGGEGEVKEMEVSSDLQRAAADTAALHTALAHKWLGVDAGEHDLDARGGDAVGFLAWAKRELEELAKGRGKEGGGKDEGKVGRRERKGRVVEEVEAVGTFLVHYKKLNDSLAYQPVPSQAALQASIPAGRLAVNIKAYTKPTPAFGPGSVAYVRKQAEELELVGGSDGEDAKDVVVSPRSGQSYGGEGSYF
ncbi:hypothetical protein DENSPDRAFT_782930, partial [Dentipellis sp. KUC8613]